MKINRHQFGDIYERFKCSNLSISEFCNNEGIAKSTFYYWQKKLLNHPGDQKFAKISIKPNHDNDYNIPVTTGLNHKAHPASCGVEELQVEIHHPNGTKIRLKGNIHLSLVGSIIKQLRQGHV